MNMMIEFLSKTSIRSVCLSFDAEEYVEHVNRIELDNHSVYHWVRNVDDSRQETQRKEQRDNVFLSPIE